MPDIILGDFSTDVTPPNVSNISPGNGTINVPKDSHISFDITDLESGLDTTSLVVYVGGILAYSSSSFQNGFTGNFTDIGGGTWNMELISPSDFPSDTLIYVTVDAQDLSVPPNIMTQYVWSFTIVDYSFKKPPYIANEFPTNGSELNPIDTAVGFDILKHIGQADINQNSIDVSFIINGVTTDVLINGVFQSGFNGTITSIANGYHVVIIPDSSFNENILCNVNIYAEDTNAIPSFVSYTYLFYTGSVFLINSKCFMIDTGLVKSLSQSSCFQPKISNIDYDINGNISLSIRKTKSLTYGKQYQIRTIHSGKLDNDLNSKLSEEIILGSGQIEYNKYYDVKGNFQPPKYVIDDFITDIFTYPTGSVFGLDLTMSKLLYTSCFNHNPVASIAMCDRNEDSFFIFISEKNYPLIPYAPKIQSISKLGKTDSNPKSATLSTLKSVNDAVKVSNNRYLIVTTERYNWPLYPNSPSVYFTIIDDDLNIINQSERYHFLEYLETSYSVSRGYTSASLYSDGNGSVYCVIGYSPDFSNNDYKTYFIRSFDGGYNWELVKTPGSEEPLTVANFIQDEITNLPPQPNQYVNQLNQKLSYDNINNKFLLTFMAQDLSTPTSGRTVTLYSNDFINWTRFNYPIFQNYSYSSTAEPLNKSFGTYRFKDQYWNLGYVNDGVAFGNYVSNFLYDNQLYGFRRGLFWAGSDNSNNKGTQLTNAEVKVIDDITYIISNSYNHEGFVIHSIGNISNVPDKTPYSHAWFGSHGEPSNGYGYTKNQTGSPIIEITDEGLRIENNVGTALWYDYTPNINDVFVRTNGLKFKVIIATNTSYASYASSSAQRIYLTIPSADDSYHFDLTVRFGMDGIKIYNDNNVAQSLLVSVPLPVLKFVEILFIAKPTNNQLNLKAFYKFMDSSIYEDKWIELKGNNVFSGVSGAQPLEFSFGLKQTPSDISNFTWKALYILNDNFVLGKSDFNFTFNDNILSYVSGSNDEYLVPIPMTREELEQQSLNGLYFSWYGLDADKNDKWNFEVITDYLADNILQKMPSIIYRSANTSSLQTITFDTTENEFGAFLFDTIVLLRTNMRYIKIQANDDNTSWSPAPFEKNLDLTIETGTIAAFSEREDEDILVVRCSNKNWIPGELKNKYIMLEKIEEIHNVNPVKDNYYRNVAFKILDNGDSYIVINTKGLLKDELNTDSPAHDYGKMRVALGDNFLIYDINTSSYLTNLMNYKYIRIYIIQSASYSTAWGSNQPSLPNERTWQIGEFDCGQRIVLFDDSDFPSDEEYDFNNNVESNEDGRIEVIKNGKQSMKFYLNYKIIYDEDKDKLEYLFKTFAEKGIPFWYIPNMYYDPDKVYLVVFSKEFNETKILPEHHSVKLILEEII